MSELARWLSHKGESQTAFMRRSGLSWATVQRAVHGTRDLKLEVGIRLCVATGGALPVSAFSSSAHLLEELSAVCKAPVRRAAGAR
jgi:hypothetical protein